MCCKQKNKKISISLRWIDSIVSCHKIVLENRKLEECPFIRTSIFLCTWSLPSLKFLTWFFEKDSLKKINLTKPLKMKQWIFWTGRTYTNSKVWLLKAKKSRVDSSLWLFFLRTIFLLRAEQHVPMLRFFINHQLFF